ncbi:Leukotoxin [Hyphomicrobium sp. 1Nfss2.1]
MIVSANSAALQILKGLQGLQETQKSYWAEDKANWVRPPNHGPWFGPGVPGQVEPISDLTKEAIARIVAIVGEGGSVDLSGQSYTHSSISASDNATIIGGEGNDSIGAQHYATVYGSGGSDSIGVLDYGKVDGGAGEDFIGAFDYADIIAGEGDDWVDANHYAKVDLGDGDDYVRAYSYAQVAGGTGNDEIRVNDHATVDGGEGDDLVVSSGHATINGGAGNDILITADSVKYDSPYYGYNDIDGGEGDDYIQTTDNSNVRGGTGNDVIRLIGAGSTVSFAKGDGQDAILSHDSFTLNISGYSRDAVSVAVENDVFVVSFAGSDEKITLDISNGATAHLTFEDSSSLDVSGGESAKVLTHLWARVDWGLEDAYYVRSSTSRPY